MSGEFKEKCTLTHGFLYWLFPIKTARVCQISFPVLFIIQMESGDIRFRF
jgi:hypothetical protein